MLQSFWSPAWNMLWSTEPTCPVSCIDWDLCDITTLPHSIINHDWIFHFAHVSLQLCSWALLSQWHDDILQHGDTSHVLLTFHSPYRGRWHFQARLQFIQQVLSLLSRSKLIGWISPGLAATANEGGYSCRPGQCVRRVYLLLDMKVW